MNQDQNHKIALVTGGGSGIGRAVACALYDAGWSLVVTGRRESLLNETVGAFESARALTVVADITVPGEVTNLFNQIKQRFGRLDLLFNNAGINAQLKPLEEISPEEWSAVMNTNISGVFLCLQEAFRLMKSQSPMGGRIINNGSISAHVPRPLAAPYTASKHAVTGLTKAASLEGRDYNIAVGQIDIGNANSALTKKIEAGIIQADGSRKVEPTIDPNEVALAVVYMAGLPLETNVPFMTVMANRMPYMGRG
jgi:NAD(P)-dependent dehydrogenase (short-subunit alcohol dehydrogenase family)